MEILHTKQVGENHNTLSDGVPHIDIGLSPADDEIGIKCCQREKGSSDAKYLQKRNGCEPFGWCNNSDEFCRNKAEAKHQREGDEGGKTEHFAENSLLALQVIAYLYKHGLGYTLHHANNGVAPHLIPFVGL